MGLIDDQRIIDFYTDYIKHHGISAGWSSMDYAQQLYTLSSECSYQNWPTLQSVLDVGSGEGHFKEFLRQHKQFKGKYTGLEILATFHDIALKKYGQDDQAQFLCEEFLAYDFGDQKFDWVFSLGSLSVHQENLQERDLAFCKKMVALSRVGATIYLNDEKLVSRGYLKDTNNLAVHNINDFSKMLSQHFSPVILQVERMLPASPYGLVIQMIKSPATD